MFNPLPVQAWVQNFHRRRHHQFTARILEDRSAQRLLLQGAVIQPELLGRQRGGEARGPRADDEHVERARVLHRRRGDSLQRLLALRQCVLDEPHSA